jgi:hypothetical protein
MYVFDDEHEERALRARLAAAAGSGRPELA